MDNLLVYIPLGVLGFIRWLSWVVRQVPATFYRPVVNDHREPLSIVTPVYQEDPELFRAALVSWRANNVTEIICVIDITDTGSIQIARELGVTVIVTDVPGKRDALRRGWEAARTPLVALVDSDTVWAPDVADKVCMPFLDPQVGAVTTRQNVMAPRTLWQHLNDMYLDYRYFHELASQSVVGQAVSCLSGRTAIYRRELLLAHSARFMNETFWGIPCLSGDDKRLTTLVLEGGHHAVLQRSACVWSQFPAGAGTFFKQRLRWARNTWRSDLRALGSRWVWRRPFLAYWMIDKAVSSFTLLASPAYLILSLLQRHYAMAAILASWWMLSRSAKLLAHLERRPSHFLTLMPAFIVISFAMAAVKIWALLTIRQQRWLTRDVAVSTKTKTVGRTGTAATHTHTETSPAEIEAGPHASRSLALELPEESAEREPAHVNIEFDAMPHHHELAEVPATYHTEELTAVHHTGELAAVHHTGELPAVDQEPTGLTTREGGR